MDPQNNQQQPMQPNIPPSPNPNKDLDMASFKKPNWIDGVNKSSTFKIDFVASLKKVFSYALWIVCFALSALSVYFVIYPGYYDYYALNEQLTQVNTEYEKVSAHLSYLNKLKALGPELDENIKIAKEALPIEEEIPYFLDQTIQIAKESALEVQAINFGGLSVATQTSDEPVDGVPVVKMKNITVRLGTNGRYDDLIKFAELYEKTRRLVSPRTMTLRVLDDQKQVKEYLEKVSSGELQSSVEEVSELTQSIAGDSFDPNLFTGTKGLYTFEIFLNGYNMKEVNAENIQIEEIVNSNPNADKTLKLIKDFRFYEESPVVSDEIGNLLNRSTESRDPFLAPSPTPTPNN
jgi:Tfp pilus assembly protein PilO